MTALTDARVLGMKRRILQLGPDPQTLGDNSDSETHIIIVFPAVNSHRFRRSHGHLREQSHITSITYLELENLVVISLFN